CEIPLGLLLGLEIESFPRPAYTHRPVVKPIIAFAFTTGAIGLMVLLNRHYLLLFGGRPPFIPFSRAAAAFFGVLRLPPRRPSATAAGFFRFRTTGSITQAVGFINFP